MRTCNTVIVDDEAMIRRGIERMVRSGEGWNVLGTFSDGKEALEFIVSCPEPVDLLITDVKMPEMDGLTLIREARRHAEFVPLLVSGYDDFEYVRAALREGAVDYILKPIDRGQFRVLLKELRHKIRRSRREKTIALLRRLTEDGGTAGPDDRWERLFPQGTYQLLCFSVDQPLVKTRDYTEEDWRLMRYALVNIAEEIIEGEPSGAGWVWEGPDRNVRVLRHFGPEPDEPGVPQAGGLAEKVRAAVAQNLPFTVSASVSPLFHDLDLLPDMNRHAGTLLYYRLLDGGNRVYAAQPHGVPEVASVPPALSLEAKKVRTKLEEAALTDAEQRIETFFESLQTCRDPGEIEQAVRYLLIQILSVRVDADPKAGMPGTAEKMLDLDPYTRNIRELKRAVNEQARETVRSLRERRESADRKPVEQAKAWIRERLAERLTIRRIAEQVHLNPTYFCELFKMHTGETVLDYITRLRMERAGELLAQGSKVAEAAEQTGYRDSKYFTHLFKQHFGLPPSRYRMRKTETSANNN